MSDKGTKDSSFLENGNVAVYDVEDGNVNSSSSTRLRRGLSSRHITFIGFGGGIGVGLFIGIGGSLAVGGPLAILLAYSITGFTVWSVIQSLGELVTAFPVDVSFPELASRFIDPAVGFTVGWTYWYSNSLGLAVEATAIAVLVQFWTTAVNQAVWITISLVCGFALNLLPVRFFGEAETATACIKIITLTGLIILGLVITLGGAPDHHRRGFEYWKNPGAINEYPGIGGDLGRFLAFFRTLINSAFAYAGSEVVVLTAAEARDPSRQIPRAVKLFIYRLLFFYVIGSLIIGMIVPSNDPDLVSGTGNANSSPWVIAIRMVGIKGLPSVINAAIITSAWSAGNTYLFIASRTLRGLSLNGQAPRFLARTTRAGVPVYAVGATGMLGLLAYLSVGSGGAAQAFSWLQSLITLITLLNWGTLSIVYIRFRAALKAQGVSRLTLPWRAPLQPFAAYFAVVFCAIMCVFNGFGVFLKGAWSTSDFFVNYISAVVFFVPLVGYKLIRRTKFVKAHEADLASKMMDPADVIEERQPKTWVGKVFQTITS